MKRRSDPTETEEAKKMKMAERRQIKKEIAEEQAQEKMQNAVVADVDVVVPEQHAVMTPQNTGALPQPVFPASPQDIVHHHQGRYHQYWMQSQHLAQWWNMMQAAYHHELQILQSHMQYHGQALYHMSQLLGGGYTPPTGHPSWFQYQR